MLLYDDIEIQDYSDDIVKKYYQVLHESEYSEEQLTKEAEEVSQQIDEATEYYNKVQKILDISEMGNCHPYLYSLDLENLNVESKNKIDKLYNLGIQRGMISENGEDTEENNDTTDETQNIKEDEEICGGPDSDISDTNFDAISSTPTNQPTDGCTVMYKATKNGITKTGEYYSKSCDFNTAKADCTADMGQLGYTDINILSIEKNNTDILNDVSVPDSQINPIIDELGDEIYETDAEDEAQETGDDSVDTTSEEPKNDNVTDSDENVNTDDKESDTEEKTSDDTQKEDDKEEVNKEEKEADSGETSEEPTDGENKEEKEADSGETSEEPTDGENKEENTEEKKLTTAERSSLKTEYTEVFKSILTAMKIDKSFNDMNLKEKTEFLDKLGKKWTKEDPELFMSNKDQETLWNKKIKTKA